MKKASATSASTTRLRTSNSPSTVEHPSPYASAAQTKALLAGKLRMMESYGLVALKKNVREIEPMALATSFKILID